MVQLYLICALIILTAPISRETGLLFPAWPAKQKLNTFFLRKSERIYLELTMTMWRSSRMSCGAIVGGERV